MKRETILVLFAVALILATFLFASFRATGRAVLSDYNESNAVESPTVVYNLFLIATSIVLLVAWHCCRKAGKKKEEG